MMKILFSSLLILLAATLARAQDPNIQVVLPYKDGFLGVGSGGENVAQVWASKDGRKFDAVQRCKGLLLDAVVAGPRLVVATSADGLYVIALDGSWRTEHTPLKDQLLALASDGQHALALSATKQWRLSADGKWSTEALWLPKEGVASRLAFGRGVWVVAGEGPAEDAHGGGPTRIAWSVDGQKWQPAKIEADDARGVMALAGNAQGFLAITGTGDGLFSADGNVWRPAQLPGEPFSSELFTAAGKFWLLERADRPPHRLRSSVDGKTWTSSENLPMEMRAQFLIEKDGQAWIFGTDAENFGVIARADQPHEPAAPVPVTVAQAPQPATVTTPAPVVSPAKPALPVTTAPASAVAGTNNPIAVVAAALAEFDRAMHVASPGEYPRAGITLLKTLRANASAHPSLPAFTDAMRDAIGMIVEEVSGPAAYHELTLGVDDKDVKPLMNRLSQEKREVFARYNRLWLDVVARAQANRTPVPDMSQAIPDYAKYAPPTKSSAKKGDAPKDTGLDLQRVYGRVATGERGAVADLILAQTFQISVPGHEDLVTIWARIYNSLGGSQALLEDLWAGKIKPETVGVLAQDGSAICQFFEAKRRSEKTPIEQTTDEDLALCEKSAAGGYRPAVNYVKKINEARAGKPETKPATAADWFKAAEAAYRLAATSKPATSPPAEEMATKLALPAKDLASFESFFTNATDLAKIGPPAALLLKNLDGKIEAAVYEAIFSSVVAYVADNAGITGYLAFSQSLPQPLSAKADKLLPADKRAKLLGAQFALMGGGGLPENVRQAWPAAGRTRKESQGQGIMDLEKTRARLLSGDAGGAMDLALEYYNGWGVPTDTDLFIFFQDIAARLNPQLKSLPKEPEAMIDALIAANSAHGRYMRATALLPKDQQIIPPGKARTLLEEAAARGHSIALMQLTLSDVAERQNASRPAKAP